MTDSLLLRVARAYSLNTEEYFEEFHQFYLFSVCLFTQRREILGRILKSHSAVLVNILDKAFLEVMCLSTSTCMTLMLV